MKSTKNLLDVAIRNATIVQKFSIYFIVVDTCVSSNPEIAALIWGGVRFVIQVFSLNIIAPELINIIDSA